MSFANLGLSDKVLAAVEASGYTTPTPIQEGAIPHVLKGEDVLGLAQTGTGKTASFTLPMLTLLEKGRARARMPRTLILEPTRELAAQVEEAFQKLGTNHKLTVALLIGGVSFDEQDRKLGRGADVVIATPGRLLDHFERGKLLLTGIDILVIDEADRMLDMGFIPDIERICKLLPFTRQTLFFSATMPPEIQGLADKFLHNPARVEVSARSSTADTVTQVLVSSGSEPHAKRSTLREQISAAEDLNNAIVFCNRKRDVATVARSLQRHGFNAGALHGDMDQRARMQTLDSFRSGELKILVASDVAARGLDIPAVSHVVNYDVPTHSEDYVHRIGRTGRAGRSGMAITIATRGDAKYVASIEKLIGRAIDAQGESLQPADSEEKPKRSRSSKSAKSGGSKRGGRGKERDAKAEPAAEASPTEPAEKSAPSEKSGKTAKSSEKRAPSSRKRSDKSSRKEEPVIGMGDHVPAFLLRSVRSSDQS